MKILNGVLSRSINLLRICADFFFPGHCLLCKKPGILTVCKDCDRLFQQIVQESSIIYISDYNECARHAVHLFKYHNHRNARRFIEEKFKNAVQQISFCPDYIVAVPVFDKKNHMDSAVKIISETIKKPVFTHAYRNRYTKPQYTLDREMRKLNVENCFSIKKNQCLKQKKILFVDDIYTTGATINALKTEFEKAGIAEWKALVFACARCDKSQK